MKKLNVKKLVINPSTILFASTDVPDYEMSKIILVKTDGGFAIIEGSHCSCYDFDETEFEAFEYTEEELKTLALNCGKPETDLRKFILNYFT